MEHHNQLIQRKIGLSSGALEPQSVAQFHDIFVNIGWPKKVLPAWQSIKQKTLVLLPECIYILKSIFINLDFDTSASQVRYKLLEIYQLKDEVSFSREADFGVFGVINFYRSQM